MVNVKNVLLFGAAVSGLVIRDVNTILNNLKAIDTSTNTFTKDTKAWDGTAGGSVTVQNDYKDIDNKVKAATDEVKNSEGAKNSADSNTILNYVKSPLTPDIKAALDALTGRKADVTKAGLTTLAKNDLTTLKADTDALGAALINIASSDTKAAASAAISSIDVYFSSAIAVFS